jgi:hypothetical protein
MGCSILRAAFSDACLLDFTDWRYNVSQEFSDIADPAERPVVDSSLAGRTSMGHDSAQFAAKRACLIKGNWRLIRLLWAVNSMGVHWDGCPVPLIPHSWNKRNEIINPQRLCDVSKCTSEGEIYGSKQSVR